MTNNELIQDTLYNDVSSQKIYSLTSNEVDELQDSFTDIEWCPPQISSPLEGMGSVAGFGTEAFPDLPSRQSRIPEKFMRFYSKPFKGSPDVIPAICAIYSNPVETGVDYRPHLLDAISKNHLPLILTLLFRNWGRTYFGRTHSRKLEIILEMASTGLCLVAFT